MFPAHQPVKKPTKTIGIQAHTMPNVPESIRGKTQEQTSRNERHMGGNMGERKTHAIHMGETQM